MTTTTPVSTWEGRVDAFADELKLRLTGTAPETVENAALYGSVEELPSEAKAKVQEAMQKMTEENTQLAETISQKYKEDVEELEGKGSLSDEELDALINPIADKAKKDLSDQIDKTTLWFKDFLRKLMLALGLSKEHVQTVVRWYEKLWSFMRGLFTLVWTGVQKALELIAKGIAAAIDAVKRAYAAVVEHVSIVFQQVHDFLSRL